MAGEIEEPFSFNFQADSLHSGSISFGRFESESLSWERRSSFSHNRYLEEVEKCSKPGSVIEKKAYFEAHFRKKALLLRASSESQNGTEYQTSNGYILDNINYQEEYEDVNEGNSFSRFDESPDGSDNHEEREVIDYEREDMVNPYCESQMEPASENVVVEGDLKHDKTVEIHLIQTRCDEIQLDSTELNIEVKEILIDEAVNVDGVSRSTDSSPVRRAAEKDVSSSELRGNSPQSMDATESKLLKSQINVTLSQRTFRTKSFEDFVKNSCKNERQRAGVTKTDEQSSQIVIPTPRSVLKTPIPDVSRTAKAKLSHESKSVNRTKKVVEAQFYHMEKDEAGACHTLNRPKQIVKTSMPVIKFKSEERAERRKEFYNKLEKTMHAKEVEMNQIQARTQEKTEAEIKQFRKSLNFKAIPMPSFYREAVQPRLDKSKAFSISTKSTRIRSKSSSPGSGAAARSSSQQKAENNQTVSANGSMKSQVSGTTDGSISLPCEISISVVSSAERNNSVQAGMKIEVAEKKEGRKDKYNYLQKNQVSEGNKVIKGQRVGGQLKGGSTRSSNQIGRKDLKGVVIGSCSGLGNLAVGVAS